MASDDPYDLTLVIEDPLAPRVLFYFDRVRPRLDKVDLDHLAADVGSTLASVQETIGRCETSGLLLGVEGIAPVARTWIRSQLVAKLGIKRAKPGKSVGPSQ